MLAFALAHSMEASDRNDAARVYETLIHDRLAEAQDRGNLASLLLDMGRPDEAKAVVLQAVTASSHEVLELLGGIGQRIVGQTGDREFRKLLEAAISKRGGHE